MNKIIVAIDGHSSCGKSTMAKALARAVGYIYVDTGAMYRAVALYALRHGLVHNNRLDETALEAALPQINIHFAHSSESELPTVRLNGEDVEEAIRTLEVSQWVSPVAAMPAVRAKLTALQQQMGEAKGIVMDGRDIGTTVFPQAELKIFVTASAEVRAQRRYDELMAKGTCVDYASILENVRQRDHIDSTREISPLRQAKDARVLDNSQMTREAQQAWLMAQFRSAACPCTE
ncbi:MAG: (d)CMP kinase [Bacteroidales bacterium]|nr:(d)CMP kinase [Bacteroidales bacterium]